MTDLLEKDKDRLLTELSAAASAEKAIHVLENEIDKLLLKHNEQCETDRERESAAYMMQAVRLSLPLIAKQIQEDPLSHRSLCSLSSALRYVSLGSGL